MSNRKFWMVLGNGTPTHRHPSKQSAQIEAERLARQMQGHEFIVLEALATVVKSDMQWDVLALSEEDNADPDAPF